MKVRKRDYLKALFDIFIGRRLKEASKKARYTVELGGKDGFEINGIGDYWGRYGSIDKIVELASNLESEEDSFEFYYPAKQYDRKYSHRIGIAGLNDCSNIEVEYLEASAQCGAFYRSLPVSDLKQEIERLDHISDNPENYGYVYRDWADV